MPKYLELVEWIEEQIKNGELQPGQKMYSENDLKEMFQISRQTVRHAIGVLESEGIIRRIRGSGTYIRDAKTGGVRSNRIALITTYTDNYIFPRMIQGIESALSEGGYSVQLSFTYNQHSRECAVLKELLERDEVGGIICETTKSALPNPNIGLYEELMRRGIPILFINSYYPTLKAPHVSMNDRQAGKIITQYLLNQGHRKVLGLFKLDDAQGHLRYQGFCEALHEAGLEPLDSRIVWLDTEDVKHLELCESKILARMKGCTAAVCYNDELAFLLQKLFREHGVRVPDDISLVGIDDTELAVLGDVKLTSVPFPMEKFGEVAVKNLLHMMEDRRFDGTCEFDVEVVERDSVKNLKIDK